MTTGPGSKPDYTIKLKEARHLRGFTIQQAADAVVCSPSFIYSIESGTLGGSPEVLTAIEVFYGVENGTIPRTPVSRGLRRAGDALVRALELLRREMRRLGLAELKVTTKEGEEKNGGDRKDEERKE